MKKFNFEDLIKPSAKEIQKYIPGKSNLNGDKNVIKLSSNESPFKLPKNVYKKAKDLISLSNEYPDGDSHILKKEIARTFNLKHKNIICGNGSDDILSIIAQTFSTENDEVICSEYGFTYYPIIAKAAGCKVIISKSEKLGVSCSNIIKSISNKTKIIFIANPNNPTGTIIFKDELCDFLTKVPENIIVVLDGAYSEFITNRKYTDGINLINKFKNLIITRTFSKVFALAGLRLGWGYANQKIIELLERVRGPFNVNSIAQSVGTLVLKEKKFLERSIKHNNKWRNILPKKIKSLGLEAHETFANFVLVKVEKKKFSKKRILFHLTKKKIIVRNLDNYGLHEFFRVSIGSSKNLKKFLKELKHAIDQEKCLKK